MIKETNMFCACPMASNVHSKMYKRKYYPIKGSNKVGVVAYLSLHIRIVTHLLPLNPFGAGID